MSEDKIEHCPCCGEKVSVIKDMFLGLWFIVCDNCGLSTKGFGTREQAICNWNTRPESYIYELKINEIKSENEKLKRSEEVLDQLKEYLQNNKSHNKYSYENVLTIIEEMEDNK